MDREIKENCLIKNVLNLELINETIVKLSLDDSYAKNFQPQYLQLLKIHNTYGILNDDAS